MHRTLAELNMLRDLDVAPDGSVRALVALTVPGCPLKDKLATDMTAAAHTVEGVGAVHVDFTVMTDDERARLVPAMRRR